MIWTSRAWRCRLEKLLSVTYSRECQKSLQVLKNNIRKCVVGSGIGEVTKGQTKIKLRGSAGVWREVAHFFISQTRGKISCMIMLAILAIACVMHLFSFLIMVFSWKYYSNGCWCWSNRKSYLSVVCWSKIKWFNRAVCCFYGFV